MIVYGAPSIEMPLGRFAASYGRRLAQSPPPTALEEARIRLVLAGQLEQAVADAGLGCGVRCRALTAAAAEAFLATFRGISSGFAEWCLENEARALCGEAQGAAGAVPLSIRTPEGFAWYGLYPDAYAQAADLWAGDHKTVRRVIVVGIRSIGTTLAAVVAAVLRSRGLETLCLTVRPAGHPFDRRVALPPELPPADWAIVADEGPGLSGSSMASVAAALEARGHRSETISFFPGHGFGPGPRASHEVQRRWAQTPASVVSWSGVRLEGRSGDALLALRAGEVLGEAVEMPLQEMGGGAWRDPSSDQACYATAPALEQPKRLARTAEGRGILLKFSGLSLAPQYSCEPISTLAEEQQRRLARLAGDGFTVAPLGSLHGWLLLPWVRGRRLRHEDANASLLRRIGSYIARTAGRPLTAAERDTAHQRLYRILSWNAGELLGRDRAARAVRAAAAALGEPGEEELPAYGDGRLAPYEWIETEAAILKLDAGGHDHDHTAVGRQSIWWDIAGACVEWDLDGEAAEQLAAEAGVAGSSGLRATSYRAVYAALRAGIAGLSLDVAPAGSPDRAAFSAAFVYYRRRLEREIDRLACGAAALSSSVDRGQPHRRGVASIKDGRGRAESP
jgi:hypothetical protein